MERQIVVSKRTLGALRKAMRVAGYAGEHEKLIVDEKGRYVTTAYIGGHHVVFSGQIVEKQ